MKRGTLIFCLALNLLVMGLNAVAWLVGEQASWWVVVNITAAAIFYSELRTAA